MPVEKEVEESKAPAQKYDPFSSKQGSVPPGSSIKLNESQFSTTVVQGGGGKKGRGKKAKQVGEVIPYKGGFF